MPERRDDQAAATTESRDPFADDVLERLIRSNQDYQREHGNYIVPLAERLLATRHRLQEAQQRANAAEVEISRLKDALKRIEDTPHFENLGGVCPACMAEVALADVTRTQRSPDEQSAGCAAPASGASSGDCTCDPEAYDLGPEGQKRYFPDRGCPVHGDPEWIASCIGDGCPSPFRSEEPCPTCGAPGQPAVVDELAVRRVR